MTYLYHPLSQEHRTGIWKPGIPPDQLLHQEHGYTCVYCEVVVVTEVSEGVVTLCTRARYSPDQLLHQEDGCKCLYVVVLVTKVAVGVECLYREQWWCPGWQPY